MIDLYVSRARAECVRGAVTAAGARAVPAVSRRCLKFIYVFSPCVACGFIHALAVFNIYNCVKRAGTNQPRVLPARSNPNRLFAAEWAQAGVVGNTGSSEFGATLQC